MSYLNTNFAADYLDELLVICTNPNLFITCLQFGINSLNLYKLDRELFSDIKLNRGSHLVWY